LPASSRVTIWPPSGRTIGSSKQRFQDKVRPKWRMRLARRPPLQDAHQPAPRRHQAPAGHADLEAGTGFEEAPYLIMRSSRVASRSQRRVAATSLVYGPCRKLPLRAPVGAPLPSAPPCILHLRRPETGADLQGAPARVRAPQRSECDTGPVSVRRMGLSVNFGLLPASGLRRDLQFQPPPGRRSENGHA
jgi:hypothetical protein